MWYALNTRINGKATITIASGILAVCTFAIHFWNRTLNHTISSSTPDEKNVALIIFLSTLLLLYSMPFIVALLTKKIENNNTWPVFEICVAITGILIIVIFISVPDLVPYPLNQDIVGGILSYIAIVIAYSFMVKRFMSCLKVRSHAGIFINFMGILIMGILLFAGSWMIVYLE